MSTYVLVHGAWHGAWCWFKVIPLLERSGNRVVAPDLPSHGVDRTPTGTVDLQAYVDRVCEVLDACHEPVILVGHSMGGIVISQAAEARPDKVAKLVYLSAFLLADGQTLLDVAQADERATVLPNLVFSDDRRSATVRDEAITETFYADCDEADVALARSLLVPQPVAPLSTPLNVSAANWGRVPRVYIECVHDRAISIDTQRMMYGRLRCEQFHTLPSGHSPFLSMADRLADHLLNP